MPPKGAAGLALAMKTGATAFVVVEAVVVVVVI